MSEATQELVDQLYRAKVLAARAMPADEKLLAGLRLFEFACRVSADGIRQQHPDADEQQVQEMLAERLALGRRLEQSE
jgi:hypothetical protein